MEINLNNKSVNGAMFLVASNDQHNFIGGRTLISKYNRS